MALILRIFGIAAAVLGIALMTALAPWWPWVPLLSRSAVPVPDAPVIAQAVLPVPAAAAPRNAAAQPAAGAGMAPDLPGSDPFAAAWAGASPVELDPDGIGDGQSVASAVSADGRVVAGYIRTGSGRTKPFVWTAGSGLIRIPTHEGRDATIAGLSADGAAVVVDHGAAGLFVWRDDRMVRIGERHGLSGASGDGTAGAGFAPLQSVVECMPPDLPVPSTCYSADCRPPLGQRAPPCRTSYGFNDRAFRWSEADGQVDLGTLRHDKDGFARALMVSRDGSAIVGYAEDGNDQVDQFRWTAHRGMEALGLPSPRSRVALNVPDGSVRALAVSPDGGAIAGMIDGEMFLWTEYGGVDLLDARARPAAVAPRGAMIVGSLGDEDHHDRAFAWTRGDGLRILAPLIAGTGIASECVAIAVSDDGSVIVGSCRNARGVSRAVMWRPGWQARGTRPAAQPDGGTVGRDA